MNRICGDEHSPKPGRRMWCQLPYGHSGPHDCYGYTWTNHNTPHVLDDDPGKYGGFVKHDKDKSRPELFPPELLLEIGRVLAFGAHVKNYGADNWQKCDDPKRYEGAAMRHLLQFMAGESLDPESGMHHLAHCICSVAFLWGITDGGMGANQTRCGDPYPFADGVSCGLEPNHDGPHRAGDRYWRHAGVIPVQSGEDRRIADALVLLRDLKDDVAAAPKVVKDIQEIIDTLWGDDDR